MHPDDLTSLRAARDAPGELEQELEQEQDQPSFGMSGFLSDSQASAELPADDRDDGDDDDNDDDSGAADPRHPVHQGDGDAANTARPKTGTVPAHPRQLFSYIIIQKVNSSGGAN